MCRAYCCRKWTVTYPVQTREYVLEDNMGNTLKRGGHMQCMLHLRNKYFALCSAVICLLPLTLAAAAEPDAEEPIISPVEVDVELVHYYPRVLNYKKEVVSEFLLFWCATNTRGVTVSNIQGRLHFQDNDLNERLVLPWRYDNPIPGYARVCGRLEEHYMVNSPGHAWLAKISGNPVITDFELVDVSFAPYVDNMPFNTIGATKAQVLNMLGSPFMKDTVSSDKYGSMGRFLYIDHYMYGFPCVLQYLFKDDRLVATVTIFQGNEDDPLLRLADYEALKKHVESEYQSPAENRDNWLNEWFYGDEKNLTMALISGIHQRATVWINDTWFAALRTMYEHGENILVTFVTADKALFMKDDSEDDNGQQGNIKKKSRKKQQKKPHKKKRKPGKKKKGGKSSSETSSPIKLER